MEAPGERGSSPWSGGQGLHTPEEGPGLSLQQILVLAVGLGRNGHYLLIVFGTYCVILEERKGTYQPLIEIQAFYRLFVPCPLLPPTFLLAL